MNKTFLLDFENTLTVWKERLSQMTEAESVIAPAPGKWCAKEIVGHLVDSASNNHQRFIRAQFQEDMIFPTYAQDDWVIVQHYKAEPWVELVELWHAFNRHLLYAVSKIPDAILKKPRAKHNLDRIAWKIVPANEPATLEYFIEDYLGHLKHHLDQIRLPRG